jgi:ABC-2 type transport system permease protein
MMTRLVAAEMLRLRTVRIYWLMALGAVTLIAGAVVATAAATTVTPGISSARSVLAIAGAVQTVALVAGVLSVTGDFRYKTITSVVLITPRRTQLLIAKLITMVAVGLVLGLVTSGIAVAITLPILGARHIPAGVAGGSVAAIIVGCGIATALAAAIGVGVGAIIRNQVAAVIAVLALLYVMEPLLGFVPHVGTVIQQYGLGGLAAAASHTVSFPSSTHLLGQAAAALVLAGYATGVMLIGTVLLRRRDIIV